MDDVQRIKSVSCYRNIYCKDCIEIAKLQKINIVHWNKFQYAEMNDPIEQRNYHKDKEDVLNGLEVLTLDNFKKEYRVENRTKKAERLITEIEYARRHLYEDVKPYLYILETMFDKKYSFWKDGGNYWYYIRNSLVSYLVIHLKEFFDNGKNKSKLSLYRIKNVVLNNKNNLYKRPKITCVRTFEKSGDVSNVAFENYPIDEYLKQLDVVLKEYEPIIQSIEDYRNNVYAHVGDLKDVINHQAQLTLKNIRKTVNALKVIFDGLSYSIAPDKFVNIQIDYNIWIDHLNIISRYYDEHVTKPLKDKGIK